MCGITGFITDPGRRVATLESTVRAMADRLAHRGPDDAGVWADADAGVALGHRRLAILDLSPAGHQPMLSACGRYVIAFNGEIYNHLELRQSLDDEASALPGQTVWRGHSDTETLLAAIAAWGLEATLRRCVGMFAIALWDRRERTLHLARDRFGEKPLYYGWLGSGDDRVFAFASELKALRTYPGFANPVCREALAQYLRFMYVPAPLSIYQSIYKLEPGRILSVSHAEIQAAVQTSLRQTAYWSVAESMATARQQPLPNEGEALFELEAVLDRAVSQQSLADVPLGAFLSGGVDSSLIVALMQRQASQPVKTFTIGFEEAGFDESPHARAVARHLGTDHHEYRVTAADALDVIPSLPRLYDEPFADSSQIPTHLVCRQARQQLTVALSGDAGDELFGGYNRYFWGPRIWDRLAWLPHPVRRRLGNLITALPVRAWDTLGTPLNAVLPGNQGIAQLGFKAHKLAAGLRNVTDLDDLYLNLVTVWPDPARVVRNVAENSDDLSAIELPADLTGAERMMFWDTLTYLPDDILCKVDRAAMATSLETRVPFLDHRVAELAWRLPLSLKIRNNQGKWGLRQVLYQYVQRELIERPKAGFGIPVGQWLRGPLREWAEALLDEQRLQREGYLHPAAIRETWRQHLSGRYDWTPRLWSVLMFQAWLEQNPSS